MSKKILIVLLLGILSGCLILPKSLYEFSDILLDIGLCMLLFFVGIEIGNNKDIFKNIKNVGFKIFLIPIATAIGSLLGGIVCGLIFKINIFGALAVASGFAWYSLSSIIIAPISSNFAAIAFLSNVFRELLAFITIPFIAKHIGYLETIAVGGAISMDTGLPIITKNTTQEIVIISFVSGIIISLLVPLLVPIFVGFM